MNCSAGLGGISGELCLRPVDLVIVQMIDACGLLNLADQVVVVVKDVPVHRDAVADEAAPLLVVDFAGGRPGLNMGAVDVGAPELGRKSVV